jgi:hypothetical protein
MQAFFHRRPGFAGICADELVCLHTDQRSVISFFGFSNRCQLSAIKRGQTSGVCSCSSPGSATFFLKTKKRVNRVGFRIARIACSRQSVSSLPVALAFAGFSFLVFHAKPVLCIS